MKYTVHLCPPDYPDKMFPFRCAHPPEYQMVAAARCVPGGKIELDNPICMACGAALPGTWGGNIVVAVQTNLDVFGWHPRIATRLRHIRDRYLALAAQLFDADGWTGRHRKWAELIDPNLTMKVSHAGTHGDGTRFVRVLMDQSYSRPAEDEPQSERPALPPDDLPLFGGDTPPSEESEAPK